MTVKRKRLPEPQHIIGRPGRRALLASASRFDLALLVACDSYCAVQRLEGARGRLSSAAFVRAALALAGMTEAEASELLPKLEAAAVEHREIASALRQVTKLLIAAPPQPFIGQPPESGLKMLRLLRTTGGRDISAALASIGVTPSAAFAAIVYRAARDQPDAFGEVEDAAAHEAALAKARTELEASFEQMRRSWGPQDIVEHRVDSAGVPAVRVSFRKARHLSPHQDSNFWPGSLVEFVLRISPDVGTSTSSQQRPTRARMRLERLDAREKQALEIDEARRRADYAGVTVHFDKAQRDGRVDEWIQMLRQGKQSYEVAESMFELSRGEHGPAGQVFAVSNWK